MPETFTELDQEIVSVLADLAWTFDGLAQQFPQIPRRVLHSRVKRLVRLGYIEEDDITRPAMLNLLKTL